MEAADCRTQLARLLAQQASALAELSALLEREHAQLTGNDLIGLEATIRERQQCVAGLVRTDEERRALSRSLGYAIDGEGARRLLGWCDAGGKLAAAWSQCAAAAARCRMLNDRNGALASARLQQVQARLATLIKGRRETVTYRRQGGYAADSLGRVLRTEA